MVDIALSNKNKQVTSIFCGTCKFFDVDCCSWWLQSVPNDGKATCFIPIGSKYPLIAKQQLLSRTAIYPLPHGRCFFCGKELSGRRRSYCSDEHRRVYYSRFNWGNVRGRIWERDKKTCVQCGVSVGFYDAEIDHIQAIFLGGTYWDYFNLRTLCKTCHKRKTRQDFTIKKYTKLKETILKDVLPLDYFLPTEESV